jgi:hypothetical protein
MRSDIEFYILFRFEGSFEENRFFIRNKISFTVETAVVAVHPTPLATKAWPAKGKTVAEPVLTRQAVSATPASQIP